MATYYARKNGNVNATDVWATTAGGTASDVFSSFTNADVLMANNFTVTLNVNTTVKEVRNDTTGGATAGGSFTLNSVTLTADVYAGNTTCINTSGSTSGTIVGNITGGTSGSFSYGVAHGSTGTLTITGAIAGGSASGATGVAPSAGTLNVTGNVSGATGVSATGIILSGSATVTVTGNVTGGSGANTPYGIWHNGTGALTVTGTVTGGTAVSGIANTSTGTVTIVGTSVGAASAGSTNTSTGTMIVTRAKGGPLSTSNVGVNGSSTGVTSVEEIEFGDLGASPTSGAISLTAKSSNVAVMYRVGTTKKNLVDANASGLMPSASDVRFGTVYNGGNSTGTCRVPAASSVASGVLVDATTGTAALTPAAVWDYLTSAATTSGSLGERLKNCATVASTGQQLADALTLPTG